MNTPTHPLLRLAMGALQSGQIPQALELASQCLAQAPDLAAAHLLTCRALRRLGDAAAAIRVGEAALARHAGHVPLWIELALAQRQAGLPEAAEQTCQAGLALAPHDAVLHHNLANLLQQRRAWAESEQHYRQAITLSPTLVQAHTELGRLMQALGREDEARQHFAEALAIRPDFQPAWDLLNESLARGDAVQGLHDLQRQARDGQTSPRLLVMLAQAALRLAPDNVLGHYAQGLALRLQGRLDEALAPLAQALALAPPGHAMARQALYLHTLCLMDQGLLSQAMDGAAQLLDCAENDDERAKARQLLGGLHLEAGDLPAALDQYRQAIDLAPGWLPPRTSLCGAQLYTGDLDGPALRDMTARTVGPALAGIARPALDEAPLSPGTSTHAPRPLRVGFLSGDFRRHACAYFLEPLLEQHDRTRIEAFAYATERHEDEVTRRLQALVPHWRRVADLDDEALAARIREDGIDILVDLAGLTDGHRLGALALKPAPVLIGWLGYLGPTGLSTMDWQLTDAWASPPANAPETGPEAPWRLPRPYLCYRPPPDAPEVSALPMAMRGHPTLGCFNAMPKLSDACLALWARVMQAVPEAHLLIKNKALRDPQVRERLQARLVHLGVAAERLALRGWTQDTASHLQVYQEVDLALDSTPFNGVTTTCEAAWMGVPTVSLIGRTMAARQGLSLLHAMALGEMATASEAAFVARVASLLGDAGALAELRATLRDRMRLSPLMDGPAFARAMEDAFEQAWRQRPPPHGEA